MARYSSGQCVSKGIAGGKAICMQKTKSNDRTLAMGLESVSVVAALDLATKTW